MYCPGHTSVSPAVSEGSTSELALPLADKLSQCCTLSGSSRPPRSWLRAWRTDPSLLRLSGAIFDYSTLDSCAVAWMESLAAFPASPTALLESSAESTTSATYGTSASESYARPGPDGASLRTWAEAFGSFTDASDQTLRALATASRRASTRRRKSARRMGANDCSSSAWPTPDASVLNDGANPQENQARRDRLKARHGNGNGAGLTLGAAANSLLGRQAPRTSMFGPESSPSDPTSPQRLRLNPAFVEWLMGFPEGWLSLGPINSGSSETP